MTQPQTAHQAALKALLTPDEREAHALKVASLLARNQMLAMLDEVRAEEGLTKSDLAHLAGLDPSAVRRMLTAQTANPTTENAFRLCRAMNIRVEGVLPNGDRVVIVDAPKKLKRGETRTAGAKRATRTSRAATAGTARSVRGKAAITGKAKTVKGADAVSRTAKTVKPNTRTTKTARAAKLVKDAATEADLV